MTQENLIYIEDNFKLFPEKAVFFNSANMRSNEDLLKEIENKKPIKFKNYSITAENGLLFENYDKLVDYETINKKPMSENEKNQIEFDLNNSVIDTENLRQINYSDFMNLLNKPKYKKGELITEIDLFIQTLINNFDDGFIIDMDFLESITYPANTEKDKIRKHKILLLIFNKLKVNGFIKKLSYKESDLKIGFNHGKIAFKKSNVTIPIKDKKFYSVGLRGENLISFLYGRKIPTDINGKKYPNEFITEKILIDDIDEDFLNSILGDNIGNNEREQILNNILKKSKVYTQYRGISKGLEGELKTNDSICKASQKYFLRLNGKKILIAKSSFNLGDFSETIKAIIPIILKKLDCDIIEDTPTEKKIIFHKVVEGIKKDIPMNLNNEKLGLFIDNLVNNGLIFVENYLSSSDKKKGSMSINNNSMQLKSRPIKSDVYILVKKIKTNKPILDKMTMESVLKSLEGNIIQLPKQENKPIKERQKHKLYCCCNCQNKVLDYAIFKSRKYCLKCSEKFINPTESLLI